MASLIEDNTLWLTSTTTTCSQLCFLPGLPSRFIYLITQMTATFSPADVGQSHLFVNLFSGFDLPFCTSFFSSQILYLLLFSICTWLSLLFYRYCIFCVVTFIFSFYYNSICPHFTFYFLHLPLLINRNFGFNTFNLRIPLLKLVILRVWF